MKNNQLIDIKLKFKMVSRYIRKISVAPWGDLSIIFVNLLLIEFLNVAIFLLAVSNVSMCTRLHLNNIREYSIYNFLKGAPHSRLIVFVRHRYDTISFPHSKVLIIASTSAPSSLAVSDNRETQGQMRFSNISISFIVIWHLIKKRVSGSVRFNAKHGRFKPNRIENIYTSI